MYKYLKFLSPNSLLKLYLELVYLFVKILSIGFWTYLLISFILTSKVIKIIDSENPEESVIILYNGILNYF